MRRTCCGNEEEECKRIEPEGHGAGGGGSVGRRFISVTVVPLLSRT